MAAVPLSNVQKTVNVAKKRKLDLFISSNRNDVALRRFSCHDFDKYKLVGMCGAAIQRNAARGESSFNRD